MAQTLPPGVIAMVVKEAFDHIRGVLLLHHLLLVHTRRCLELCREITYQAMNLDFAHKIAAATNTGELHRVQSELLPKCMSVIHAIDEMFAELAEHEAHVALSMLLFEKRVSMFLLFILKTHQMNCRWKHQRPSR